MRRPDQIDPPSGHGSPVTDGPSRSGSAGFVPGPARHLARGSARSKSSVRGSVQWLPVVALSCLAVACAGPGRPSPSPPPDRVRPAPPAADDEVVIEGHGSGAVPVAARSVGERFLRSYVPFLYGRARADELNGASRELRRVLHRARVRVPPARAARTPRIVRLQSTEQSSATVVVTVIVDDGDLAAYPVTALVERRAGSWQVIRLADD